MKTSLVLFYQEALEKYPYLHYIYNAIIKSYTSRGACRHIHFQEAGFQKIAAFAGETALLIIELPKEASIKKALWEKINYPALVKQLQPNQIFYIGNALPVLSDPKGAVQWGFVPDIREIVLPEGAKPAQIKRQQKRRRELLLTDQIISYSPTATEAIQVALPAANTKTDTWLPAPETQQAGLASDLKTVEWQDAFRQQNTGDAAYFLLDARVANEPELIEYLKAFSHFKKWQRSSMRLVFLMAPGLQNNKDFIEKFDTYFYKEDVHLLSTLDLDPDSLYDWIRAAYGIVIPNAADLGLDLQLAAAALGTLIIAPESPASALLLPKARFDLPATDKDSLGQILVSSYKSEILRARHIRAGLESVEKWPACRNPLDMDKIS